eukprot:gnl/TRDRNA2_/TRDRNA2_196532_c0_seq1.p1 gnl/TRDRNA2_/TRDRNA2_196532_c0~~gnl/TRDRNA2_/TRDRNA2_196532_c0_seq1.p1  ORF type:complete len:288 (-),score=27.61 gnl/TRDRNA2_/TRDRNA2_196532_c0_seq1:134-997(-)
MLFEDPWFLQALFECMPDAGLLALAQTAGFIDRAVGQWCGLSEEPIVLSQSVVKSLCSSWPRKITADWRVFFWRCLRALSEASRFGEGAILSSTDRVGEWFKVGDDLAGDMLIPQEDLYGRAWQGKRFGHTVMFHLFRFDPDEVQDILGNPRDGDGGSKFCSSDLALIQHPVYGLCSLQLELSAVEDGFVLYLKMQSVAELKVIETKHEVNWICPATPDWHILDKYQYIDPDHPDLDADTHFWFNQNCSNYAGVVRGLQEGSPLPLLISTSGPMLPEVEERVIRFFM